MNNLLRELQDTLAHEIPLTRHLGLIVDSYHNERLILKAPLGCNINHKRTAFAGSINALATLAGWGQLWLVLKELDIPGQIVIQDSSSNYLLPVKDDFIASCQRPGEEQITRLAQTLQKHKKARVELGAEVYSGHDLAAVFKGRYVLHLTPSLA
ncbi:thioesterase [Ktedonosporobacter rubrisoli]|uniref:Thioesterase n=1 Tax=Ktedonosporobacter rubrisoli TaxID=2509675 RepID=A0A4P6K2B2_KTERU|nr:thioesterase domain-containing protein [Ktedonosporobacter rubrisoli]QBD81983.1 thioesterase [Ktedonosporobacter rubrisoli]